MRPRKYILFLTGCDLRVWFAGILIYHPHIYTHNVSLKTTISIIKIAHHFWIFFSRIEFK
jgi:hypothetical protein